MFKYYKAKYIVLGIVLFLTITACNEGVETESSDFYSIVFSVSPDSASIETGESILLTASIRDTVLQGIESRPLEDKSLYWEIVIGAGELSSDTAGEVVFSAPSSIPGQDMLTVIRVFPVIDMRHERYVYINITGELLPGDTGICFKRDILPIFISNCALSGCHDSESKEDGFDLSNYEGIIKKDFEPGKPWKTEIYEVLFESGEDRMPPLPMERLSDEQTDLIYRWILEGGKNELCSDGPAGGCDTLNISYSNTIIPIVQLNCFGCHSTSNPQGGINLDTYEKVKEQADKGALLGSIKHDPGFAPMPTSNLKINNCNIRQIELWIEQGSKND